MWTCRLEVRRCGKENSMTGARKFLRYTCSRGLFGMFMFKKVYCAYNCILNIICQ